MVKIIQMILLGLLVFMPQVVMADATAYLDQHISSFGESVSLTIKVEGDANGEPELSGLKQDFEILSQSQSSNYSLVNGDFSRSNQWRLTLMPKRLGRLQIPSIKVGDMKTQALTIQVLAQQNVPAQNRDIFLEMKASVNEVFVQAQVLLTVKLYRAVNTVQPELTEPDVKHAIVQRVGEDKNFETVVGQRRYIVTERQYALFPQQSGELNVPAVQFSGSIVSGRSMFNQSGKVVRISSDPVSLHVLPQPTEWDNKETWLPAKELSLRELWTDGQDTTYKVGEPLTRTIEMRAKYLTAAQLPTLFTAEEVEGFKQYPDQPVLENVVGSDGIEGVRQEKVALIPTKAGELTLPGIKVAWWNTETQEKQTMIIPARVVDVLAADKHEQVGGQLPQSQNQAMIQGEDSAQETQNKVSEDVLIKTEGQGVFWQSLALIMAFGWVLTVFLWVYRSRKAMLGRSKTENVATQNTSLQSLQKALEKTCVANDGHQARKLLPQWAKVFYQEDISQIGQLLGKSDVMDKAVAELEKHLYAQGEKDKWSGHDLLQAIQACKPLSVQDTENEGLKSLYTK
ncbi:MAG: BatD family protein [Ghiorsea sp.]